MVESKVGSRPVSLKRHHIFLGFQLFPIYSWNLHPITPIDQFGFPINSLKDRKSGFDFSIGRTF